MKPRLLALLFLLPTVLHARLHAQKRPMTFEDLMAMKRVSDPQVSPSGKWVLFSVTDVSLAKNTKTNHLWAVPLSGGAEHQVTTAAGESNGRFSPDGRLVSYTLGDQVMLAPWNEADGTLGAAHALTTSSTGADGAIWSPDSKRLLFVSSVYPECSDKPFADEDACDKAKDDAAAASPVKAMLFTGLLYRHWDHYTGSKRSHIFVTDADGTHTRDLTPASAVGDAETPTFSLGGPLGYAWAPDAHEVAYSTNLDPVKAASTNNDIFSLRLDEPGAKAVKVSTSPGSDDAPAYSPDGKYLAFRSQARAGYESDRFRLMLLNRSTRAASEVLPAFDRWIDEAIWSGDAGSIYFTSGVEGAENIYQYSLADQTLTARTLGLRAFEMSEDVQSLISTPDLGEFSSLSLTSDGKTLVSTVMTVRHPAEIVSFAVDDREEYDDTTQRLPRHAFDGKTSAGKIRDSIFHVARITHLNDTALRQVGLARMEPFTFKAEDSTSVQGFLVKPPNFDPARKYPVKLLIHGGPQGAWGDAWSYRWNPELMAASGYVVVMINPRGSTGYGQAFIDGVNGDWGGKPYTDLMRGMDYAEQHFAFIDKTRECALGASYGGFMADWILTHTNRFACIVTHDGMFNPAAAYGTTEELWFNEWEFRRAGDREPGQPWRYQALPAEQDPFRKWSPMLHIADAKTPTLVIHGQRDYRLDVSEGLQLFTALQRLGVPSEMLYFPDEGHWVLKPQNSQLWNKTVSDWCDRWTHTNAYAAAR